MTVKEWVTCHFIYRLLVFRNLVSNWLLSSRFVRLNGILATASGKGQTQKKAIKKKQALEIGAEIENMEVLPYSLKPVLT